MSSEVVFKLLNQYNDRLTNHVRVLYFDIETLLTTYIFYVKHAKPKFPISLFRGTDHKAGQVGDFSVIFLVN